MIQITSSLRIPIAELTFTASRSSGPGGQNVNKVSTRITLLFDIQNSPSLSGAQKTKIREFYPTRINKAGVMRLVCQKHRSQLKNRELVIQRFRELIAAAFKPVRIRRQTHIPRAVKEKRLTDKKHRSQIKQNRSRSQISQRDD